MKSAEHTIVRLNAERSIRSQVAEYYRGLILRGELCPGDRLPPARALARKLGVAEANVHHALGKLAGEGLIVRRPRSGSIVARREPGLRSVAVFIPWRSLMRGEEFTRLLVRFLVDRFEECGAECHVLYDTPGGTGRNTLRRLATERRIQGIVYRTIESDELKFCHSLNVPFTGISSLRLANRVSLYTAELMEKMTEALREAGCRSFGVLTPGRFSSVIVSALHRRADAAGMEFREEWLFDGRHSPESFIVDRASFAWNGIARLNALPERPEGLMLFSDDLVDGAAMAFYRGGIRVPQDYRLAIHHTRENPVLFPFECTLVQHSIAEIAGALADQLADLCEGKPPRAPALGITLTPYMPPHI
ncbi:GntR family transcriptional regulator [uncultured Victivallis sp.]|uniref:GntR family transcriptional regulator n=1 Tax=uncultured Victivallis sp. TaxID=354118 RepID=UPI0025DA89F8|nr:GntR family transcriptional regulator [uncultured Victivallis sp.]